MAAPEFVPVPVTLRDPSYTSPPSRTGKSRSERPGSIDESGQPSGSQLGHQGPDQGYVFKLARLFGGKLQLADGEHEADAIAGGRAIALKRASQFGRAPVVHDLEAAFTIWGFLDENPPEELVTLRRSVFEAIENEHHYSERRAVVDSVRSEALAGSTSQVRAAYEANWRDQIDTEVFAHHA